MGQCHGVLVLKIPRQEFRTAPGTKNSLENLLIHIRCDMYRQVFYILPPNLARYPLPILGIHLASYPLPNVKLVCLSQAHIIIILLHYDEG